MFWPLVAMLAMQAASSAPATTPAQMAPGHPASQQQDVTAAGAALQAGKYSDAAALLEKVLAADPKDYRARFNLAFAYSEMRRDADAIEQYNQVLQQQPDLVPAHLNLGIILLRQKKPADAAPHLAIAAEKKPQDFRSQFYLAEALLGSGSADRAAAAYRKALEINPKSAAAALGLGRSLARTGQLDGAREQYLKAVQLDPQFNDALLELGDWLERKQQAGQALDLYLDFLKTKPHAVAVQERAGVLLLQQKRYPEAIEHLALAVKQSPSAANQAALAQAYVLTKQWAKAVPLLEAAAGADPASPDLHFRLATALMETMNYVAAGRQFLEVVEKQPANMEAWNGLGFALYKVGNYDGALKALDRASKLGPEPPGNHFLRAIMLDQAHQLKPALASYKKFLEEAGGKYPDDEFKARQRVRIITYMLNKQR